MPSYQNIANAIETPIPPVDELRSFSGFPSRSYEEKRNFIRMRINAQVIIKNNTGLESEGYCHNLSGGGALVETSENLPINTSVELTLHSHYGHSPVFCSRGCVVRTQPSPSGRYLVGVKY
jgi:hypothetical protein